jgi:hypothetical protein
MLNYLNRYIPHNASGYQFLSDGYQAPINLVEGEDDEKDLFDFDFEDEDEEDADEEDDEDLEDEDFESEEDFDLFEEE